MAIENKSIDTVFQISIDDQKVVGEIVRLDKYYIEVEILSPFKNWSNHSSITGMGRMSSHNFLVTYKEVSKRLLTESYRKLKIIDESIDRISNVFITHERHINSLKDIGDIEVRDSIRSKLNDWFFDDFLFTSSVTGLIASVNEEEKIIAIITSYKSTGEKIYKSDLNRQ